MTRNDGEREPVTIRDRRRIDPDTGEVRAPEPVVEPHDAEPELGEEVLDAGIDTDSGDPIQIELAERTADLQRVSAEYANYRRRVDRDRQVVIDSAKSQVASALIPVLDDLDRAWSHGDLAGPLKSVADKLGDALTGQGLMAFGAEGDAFDPALHEAVSHENADGGTGAPVVSTVMRSGYRFGERILRPAMVAVTEVAADGGPVVIDADEQPGEPTVPGPVGPGVDAEVNKPADAS